MCCATQYHKQSAIQGYHIPTQNNHKTNFEMVQYLALVDLGCVGIRFDSEAHSLLHPSAPLDSFSKSILNYGMLLLQ